MKILPGIDGATISKIDPCELSDCESCGQPNINAKLSSQIIFQIIDPDGTKTSLEKLLLGTTRLILLARLTS